MGLLTRDDRDIFVLAIPAFAALISEPLMLLADTAIIGHLGTVQLAGLAVAATVLGTIVGLCIFLAYGSTAAVARHHGAGDKRGALALGLSGVWLAVGLGVVLAALTALITGPVTRSLSSSPAVAEQAHTYLLISTLGLPAMLVVLAATGALRGVLDMRTPLLAMMSVIFLNVVLNLALVYGADWGNGGAATRTVIAQWVAAIWLAGSVLRKARDAGSPVRPNVGEIIDSARNGVPLVIRTLTLRASLLIATAVAATQGDAPLAAHQIAVTLVTLLAFALDSIAIAGQALTGQSLGAADAARTRQLTRRMIGWGVVCGVVAALLLLAFHDVIPRLFSPDAQVQSVLLPVLVVVAVIQPLSGVVFVLDGVLIGAGDGTFLAWAGLVVLAAYAPLALAVQWNDAGLTWLWVAYGGFIAARLVTLYARQRGDKWMVLGA